MGRYSPYVTRQNLEEWISEPETHMAIMGAEYDGQYSLSIIDEPADMEFRLSNEKVEVPLLLLRVSEHVEKEIPESIILHDREVRIKVEKGFEKVVPS